MSVLYLTEAEVLRLADMRAAVDAVEEAFRQMAAGEAVNVPRERAQVPGFVLHTMSAAAPYLDLAAWKAYSTTPRGGRFLVGLYELATGRLTALLEADQLGRLRTGATTGVAVSWLANRNTTELGLFGAGRQAERQLEAVATVRPLKRAFVYCRTAERRLDFAERMSARLNVEVVPVDRPQEAAEELPLVITATTSRTPVFDGLGLEEGALVCAVGSNWLNRAEIDAHVVRRADHIVCDSVDACRREAGDFVEALERGIFDWHRAVNLADVIAGHAVGRSHAENVVLFKSVGLAIEDLAVAAQIVARARQEGLGRPLHLE
jgi:ornithine cyclodeaminase/alanine dehydrogenase-like protein (mu-crystallin family)